MVLLFFEFSDSVSLVRSARTAGSPSRRPARTSGPATDCSVPLLVDCPPILPTASHFISPVWISQSATCCSSRQRLLVINVDLPVHFQALAGKAR